MYLTTNLGYEEAKMRFIHHLLKRDSPEAFGDSVDEMEEHVKRPHKRRKQSHRIITVSPENLSETSGVQLDELLNSASKDCTLYTKFQEEMLTEGTIKWRLSDEDEGDICIMNDYNKSTGASSLTSMSMSSASKYQTLRLPFDVHVICIHTYRCLTIKKDLCGQKNNHTCIELSHVCIAASTKTI